MTILRNSSVFTSTWSGIVFIIALIMVGVSFPLLNTSIHAQANYPEIQGRVNDYAGILDAGTKSQLESTLADFDRQTTNEIVVAIVPALDGIDIDTYRNELFEKWAIGKKDRDNGVLLVIGLAERKVGIEVGYGLEGALPDVTTSSIIRNEITPSFKQEDYDTGIQRGVSAIMAAIQGEYTATDYQSSEAPDWVALLIFAAIVFIFIILPIIFRGKGRGGRSGGFFWYGGGGGGGGFSGGGFSGGGGGSGGGGSSGGW